MKQEEILLTIKSKVQEEIPDAKVYLFGSRATGKIHDESDWDILVISPIEVEKSLKRKIREKLFQISLKIFDHIDSIIVSEKEWEESPSYYSLSLSTKNELIPI